jgi:hypothetical protein
MILTIMIAGVVFARRNLARGRGDRRGAHRVATFAGLLLFAGWLARAHHAGSLAERVNEMLLPGIAEALALAMFSWAVYVAIEPYVRRRVPELLIGWARVLEGKLRDARVGRDVLVGIVLGAGMAFVLHLANGLPTWFPFPAQTTIPAAAIYEAHATNPLAFVTQTAIQGFLRGLSLFCVFFLFRALLRRTLPAAIGVGVVSYLLAAGGENPWLEVPQGIVMAALAAVGIARFGLLSSVVMGFVLSILVDVPITLDLSQWYAPAFLACLGVVLGLALWAFRTSLGSQPVFGGSLED